MKNNLTVIITEPGLTNKFIEECNRRYKRVNIVVLGNFNIDFNLIKSNSVVITLNKFSKELIFPQSKDIDVEIYPDLNSLVVRIMEMSENLVMVGKSDYLVNHFDKYFGIKLFQGVVTQLGGDVKQYKDMSSNSIMSSIKSISYPFEVVFRGARFVVLPGVYPSNRFRSSRELSKFAKKNVVSGRRIADMGCSHGTMGILSLLSGAKDCTFVDINPNSIRSAETNVLINSVSDRSEVYLGNLFDPIKNLDKKFDIIFFNPPFHLEKSKCYSENCLKIASLKGNVIVNFFESVHKYIHTKTKIYLAFSNKDPLALELLEKSIKKSGLHSRLVVHKYKDTKSDVRIYLLNP